MKNYPWLLHQYNDIIEKYLKKKLHPIILMQSNNDIGVSNLILQIYKWILCSNKKKNKNCGHCLACRLIDLNNHPDVYNLYHLSKKKNIGIDVVRNVLNNLYNSSQQGGKKIVCFPEMNNLTQEASHSILKTLEEPPHDTIFFLCTNNILQINNTIKSRSTIYLIPSPSEKNNLIWLKKKNKSFLSFQLLTALRMNNNSPINAHKFLNKNTFKQRDIFMQAIKKYIFDHKNIDLLKSIYGYNTKNVVLWVFYLLIDTIKYKTNYIGKIRNIDNLKLIKIISNKNSINALKNNLLTWISYQKILTHAFNIDKKLVFTEQILSWANVILK
ncbi:DNA polymerase III subunit delta' C-terminal domain-containing protein [Buchnera aphidicola]|uniref:DNA polymerase III subunit delta' C-terminal domain-containing protein n=1 Tax=Buchnera aphidicola TaxID=9 RepID=UPI00094D7EBE|nr:DNA polymerase III subunit delta' C-terminal domain-containing protein [Buchnera aphidicola]